MTDTQWQSVALADVCSLRVVAIAPQDALEMPYVGLEHIDSGQPTLSQTGNATEVRSGKSRFQPGDVLYGKLRPYLDKAVLATHEGMCSTDILVLNPNEQIKADFLVNLLHSQPFIEHAVKTTHGVNHPRTSWSGIGQFEFSLPPLPQQRAIAHVLQTVQKTKGARQCELAVERERKAALMEHLFTHGSRGEQTKQTEIGNTPNTWEVSALADLARISSGGTPDRAKSEYWGGTIPWVRTGEIRYNTILATEERITQEGLDNSAARVYLRGTLLMAMYGQGVTRGKVAILGIDAAINQACAAIAPVDGRLLSRFAFYYLQFTYDRIRILGHGANQKNLNSHLVGSILVPTPPVDEQGEIVRLLAAIDAKLETMEREIAILQELFGGLLHQLMAGGVSVSNLVAGDVG